MKWFSLASDNFLSFETSSTSNVTNTSLLSQERGSKSRGSKSRWTAVPWLKKSGPWQWRRFWCFWHSGGWGQEMGISRLIETVAKRQLLSDLRVLFTPTFFIEGTSPLLNLSLVSGLPSYLLKFHLEIFTSLLTREDSKTWKEFIWVVVSNIFYFHPYLGKIPILTNIVQMGWFNHQPVMLFFFHRQYQLPQAKSSTSEDEEWHERKWEETEQGAVKKPGDVLFFFFGGGDGVVFSKQMEY